MSFKHKIGQTFLVAVLALAMGEIKTAKADEIDTTQTDQTEQTSDANETDPIVLFNQKTQVQKRTKKHKNTKLAKKRTSKKKKQTVTKKKNKTNKNKIKKNKQKSTKSKKSKIAKHKKNNKDKKVKKNKQKIDRAVLDPGDYFKKTDAHHLNITPKVKYIFSGSLFPRVVQKQLNYNGQMYALQLYGSDSYIFTTPITGKNLSFPTQDQAMRIPLTYHSQLLEPAGNGNFLVGVEPKILNDHPGYFTWTTEIGRTKFTNGEVDQTTMPRLTDLQAASSDPTYTADQLERVEATVSPDLHYLLILSLEYPQNGERYRNIHMAVYDLAKVNSFLDEAEEFVDNTISLKRITPITACELKGAYGNQIKEIQGLAIDNKMNVYFASETIPKHVGIKSLSAYPREIIRMAFGQTNQKKWTYAKLNAPEWQHKTTEFEGMQIVGNKLQLNVAYQMQDAPYTDYANTIYEISGLVK